MLHRPLAALACAIVLAISIPVRADDRASEGYLLDVPSATGAIASSRRLNQESHYAGTPGDQHIAEWMRTQLAADGFDATLETFQADVPQSPTREVLELMTRPRVDFDLSEAPIAADPDGTRKNAGVLPFNAGSGSGNVTAALVDTGHGTDADYRALDAAGISVRGRLVLIAYGAQFRGLLAHRAQDRGAAGIIFWSDPADRDGSLNGPAYPNGPYRPLGSVQRGSLGLPTLRIPSLPVSADTGRRLRSAMRGRVSTVPVHLRVDASSRLQNLWNTVGLLQGTDPTHEIVLGAHRDAWVYGVTDNGAGISTLLETARALGYLYRTGWRPRYSIVIAGWDGEEIGEVGSAQYVRMHFAQLRSGCIAYINEDENTTGQFFSAGAAAALEGMLPEATLGVKDPASPTQTIYQRWQQQRGGARVHGPGGGSDFESFLYEAGIPTLETAFSGVFGVYHSAFDDIRYATTQADPGFGNHRALAQLVALLTFRMASGALPYRLSPYVARMRLSLQEDAVLGITRAELAPLAAAISRFAYHAAQVDARGMNGDREIDAVQRIDRLYYGRNGYQAVAFPDLAAAMASGDHAAIAAAAARVAARLDEIDTALHPEAHK